MSYFINVKETVSPSNRKATGNNPALGPLETLVLGNTWVGDTGFNLMVVPSPLGPNGFIVIISQLFETHIFDAVPAPVPNRSLNNGTSRVGAIKYSQVVAEKVSKNILHEETGMWLNQTTGDENGKFGLERLNGELNGKPANQLISNPIVRSGTIPHGNTIQATGTNTHYEGLNIQGDVLPYISAKNFPTLDSQLHFLPTFKDTADPKDTLQLQEDYKNAIIRALSLLNLPHETEDVNAFINPIDFLNRYAKNITKIDALAVTTANDQGMVVNVPFARAVVGPQDFICTFMIQEIDNMVGSTDKDKLSAETDQVPTYYQVQYLQSIPLLFPNSYKGKDVIFPHWNVNTLIAI